MTITEYKAYACIGKGEKLSEWKYEPRELGASDIGVTISHCGICFSGALFFYIDYIFF